MRARGSKSGVKNETPKLPETRESLGKIGIFLLLNSNFPQTKFNFLQRLFAFGEIRENLLQRLPAFFNGFLLSSTAFRFLQRLSNFINGFPIFLNGFSIFLNGFPLSKKSKKIYLRWQVYERSLFELRISRHSLPELCNSR
jgi:hypothetical protein